MKIDTIKREQDSSKRNYFEGLYFLEKGLYKKAICLFYKEFESKYQVQCLKGIIFSLALDNKFYKAYRAYKKYQEIFSRENDKIDILYIYFYLGMHYEIYKNRFSLLEEWFLRPCDFQIMIFSIQKIAGYCEARQYSKSYIRKMRDEMELTHFDYILYKLSFYKGIVGVKKNHYMHCMLVD